MFYLLASAYNVMRFSALLKASISELLARFPIGNATQHTATVASLGRDGED